MTNNELNIPQPPDPLARPATLKPWREAWRETLPTVKVPHERVFYAMQRGDGYPVIPHVKVGSKTHTTPESILWWIRANTRYQSDLSQQRRLERQAQDQEGAGPDAVSQVLGR